MKAFSKNKWKYATIGLLAILAVGISIPQAFAATKATLDSISIIVTDIQAKVNHSTNGLAAIKSTISDAKTGLPAIQTKLDGITESLANANVEKTPFATVVSILPGSSTGDSETIDVPDGKILVLETVSARIGAGPDDIPLLEIFVE